MGTIKNKNVKQRKIVIFLAIILMILIGILVFGFLLKNEKNGEKQPSDTVAVETPYGSLYYSEQWKETMITEVDESNGYMVTFSGEVNGNQVKLFSVTFGESDSVAIGTLTIEEEEIPVGVEFFTLEETMDWNQEEVDIALEMRDAGNELVKYLMEKETFEANQE